MAQTVKNLPEIRETWKDNCLTELCCFSAKHQYESAIGMLYIFS